MARWRVTGDPTEGALLTLAMKLGLDPAAEAAAHPRTGHDPVRIRAAVHGDPEPAGGECRLLVKGAVERVLPRCRSVRRRRPTIPST